MGFLGMSGKTWKKIGKYALQGAGIAATPFVGPAASLAINAGLGAASGAMGGGGIKGALLGGGLGAIPGGGVGNAAGSAAKVGLKEIAKGVTKGAVTNFATGTGTGLATGQGLKKSLAGGGSAALSGLGTQGGAGGVKQTAQTIGKGVALNAGGSLASRGLQKAGVPGAIAGQGGNVFSQYLGNQFNSPGGNGSGGFVQPQGSAPTPIAPAGGGAKGVDWRGMLGGALTGSANGGGWRGAASGVLNSQGGGGGSQPGAPMFTTTNGGGGSYPGGGRSTGPTYGNGPVGGQGGGGYEPAQQQTQQQQTKQAKTPPDPNRPPTWAERYGPILTQVGGVAAGALIGQQTQKNAMKRSPEEQAALSGAQGSAGDLRQLGGSLAQQGQDYMQKPGQYFQTLLGGNRAAMSQAVAAPTAALTETYRGAERNLQQQGIRGAARDVAASDLNRDRASKIAGLTTGVQPYAAEQLAKMGQDAAATGTGALAAGGGIYANLLGQGSINRQYARKEGADTAKAIGGLVREVGDVAFKRAPTATPLPPTTTTGGKMLPPEPTAADGTGPGSTPAPVPTAADGTTAPAPAPQGGTFRPPTPFSQSGTRLGIDFRTGTRTPATSARRMGIDFGAGKY